MISSNRIGKVNAAWSDLFCLTTTPVSSLLERRVIMLRGSISSQLIMIIQCAVRPSPSASHFPVVDPSLVDQLINPQIASPKSGGADEIVRFFYHIYRDQQILFYHLADI